MEDKMEERRGGGEEEDERVHNLFHISPRGQGLERQLEELLLVCTVSKLSLFM